jgi:hypothetical protein
MATKQGRREIGLLDKPTEKTAPSKLKSASPTAKGTRSTARTTTSKGSGESTALVRSFAIRTDQFENLTALSAYNKLKRIQPDSVSAIVREAIDQYLERADDTFRKFMPKGDDEARKNQ